MNHRETRRSFSAGELDPGLVVADDLAIYSKGLRKGRNILVSPTGGFTDRGGFRHSAFLRNRLEGISLASATITTPPGGSTVIGFDPVTEEPIIVITDPVVPIGGGAIVHVDFGAAVEVGLVDITDLAISGADALDSWCVEYSNDDASWTAFGASFDAYAQVTSRRAALAPGESVTARYWRLYGKADIAGRTFSAPAMTFWRETDQLSNVKAFSVSFDSETEYCLFATDRTLEVYAEGGRVVSIATVHTHEQIPDVTETQSLDTLLLFHPDVPVRRVFRVRGNAEWDSRAQAFENVPLVQFEGETYTNGRNEKQAVLLLKMTDGTDKFSLRFDGEDTAAIDYDGNDNDTGNNIKAALEALDNVETGDISVTRIGNNLFEVEFGGSLAQRRLPVMSFAFLGPGDGDEIMEVTRTQEGKRGGEPVFSASRGYPACGRFFQQRLTLAGFRARPASVLFSVLDDYFNLDVEIEQADGAILLGIDDDQMKRIRQLWAADRFQLFTDDSEFFIDTRGIAKGELIPFARATGRGLLQGSSVVEADDVTLFVQRDGQALRAFFFDESVQSYRSPPVSRLSPHLIKAPVSMAARRGDGPAGAEMVFLANEDGSGTLLCLLQSEDFSPFVQIDTAGDRFVAFGAEGRSTLYAVTERGGRRRVEVYDPTLLYDAGVRRSYESDTDTVDGLEHLEGRTVELWLEGRPWGEAVVSGGSVELPAFAREVQLGLKFEVEAELTPGTQGPGPMGVHNVPVRHYEVSVSIRDTGALSLSANGQPPKKAILRSYGTTALQSVDEVLFTGDVIFRGLGGVKRQSTVTISQPFRAPLDVAGVVLNYRSVK